MLGALVSKLLFWVAPGTASKLRYHPHWLCEMNEILDVWQCTFVSKLLFWLGVGVGALLSRCFPGTALKLWAHIHWRFVMAELLDVCQCFDPQLDGLYCQACGRLRRPSDQPVSWYTCMQRSSELDDRLARLSAGAA